MSGWRVPVLAYHASRVEGPDYDHNDHVALATDLALLARLRWRVVPLAWVVEQRLGLADRDLSRCVALSADDGTVLDVEPVDYPGQGRQPGFLACLREAEAVHPDVHLTSFVIADPAARARMDTRCLHGLDWMGEHWWAPAAATGRIAVECHGWDHNHPELEGTGPEGMPRGDFFVVDTPARAAFEIDQAVHYLNARLAPGRCRLFAYPFGHAGDFLRHDYLPSQGPRLGIQAAFGTQGEPLTAASDPWYLPRYVSGWHWRTPAALEALLADAA